MKITIKKKILLLGGSGFIGSTIFKDLKKKFHIRTLSRNNGYDLRNPRILEKYIKKKNLITL